MLTQLVGRQGWNVCLTPKSTGALSIETDEAKLSLCCDTLAEIQCYCTFRKKLCLCLLLNIK